MGPNARGWRQFPVHWVQLVSAERQGASCLMQLNRGASRFNLEQFAVYVVLPESIDPD